MKKVVAPLLVVSMLFGCATPPHELMAKRVSSIHYEDKSCKQLELEHSELVERRDYLHKELQELASNDAMQMTFGILLLWPALFLLEGGDGPMADEYTEVKGKISTIETVSNNNSCPQFAVKTVEDKEPEAKKDRSNERCGMYHMCE